MKTGFASMVKGGLIMDVINPEQARIAEEAGVSLIQFLITFINIQNIGMVCVVYIICLYTFLHVLQARIFPPVRT